MLAVNVSLNLLTDAQNANSLFHIIKYTIAEINQYQMYISHFQNAGTVKLTWQKLSWQILQMLNSNIRNLWI
ncbi:hypothetical protein ACFP3I_21860 [Chryseobacterium arachidis]|uniref:hypothetical protein n=1 Tax=Chryseobacterium arachidis TaxID=1416778 RepID=UPI00360B150B